VSVFRAAGRLVLQGALAAGFVLLFLWWLSGGC